MSDDVGEAGLVVVAAAGSASLVPRLGQRAREVSEAQVAHREASALGGGVDVEKDLPGFTDEQLAQELRRRVQGGPVASGREALLGFADEELVQEVARRSKAKS